MQQIVKKGCLSGVEPMCALKSSIKIVHIRLVLWQESLNSDDEQFHNINKTNIHHSS